MRKLLSAVLVLVMLVTLMVPCAMAAEPENEETNPASAATVDAKGGGFTDQLLSAEKPEPASEEKDSNMVANIVVFAVLAVVVGVSVARIIDKKKKLYK